VGWLRASHSDSRRKEDLRDRLSKACFLYIPDGVALAVLALIAASAALAAGALRDRARPVNDRRTR